MKIGCDIVHLRRFITTLERGGSVFLNRVFTKKERKNRRSEQLAGIFAAKEALMKAGLLRLGRWQEVEIIKDKKGRPRVNFFKKTDKVVACDLSISHNGDYVIAVAVTWKL